MYALESPLYKTVIIATTILALFSFDSKLSTQQHEENKSFTTGEVLKYNLHYGFLDAGQAVITVDTKLYKVNNHICYKLNVDGKTTGTTNMLFNVKDVFGSYIDTATLFPEIGYRIIKEGKYRKKEMVYFDQETHNVKVVVEGEPEANFKTPEGVLDLVSGYYNIRNINFTKLSVGTVITKNVFFEDKNYSFSMEYLGKEKLKTSKGTFNTIVISPLMPENALFRSGKNSVRLWMSDDANKIPLKAKAEMFVGSVVLDIEDYSGLRNQ